jgi:hypothetical protein
VLSAIFSLSAASSLASLGGYGCILLYMFWQRHWAEEGVHAIPKICISHACPHQKSRPTEPRLPSSQQSLHWATCHEVYLLIKA